MGREGETAGSTCGTRLCRQTILRKISFPSGTSRYTRGIRRWLERRQSEMVFVARDLLPQTAGGSVETTRNEMNER